MLISSYYSWQFIWIIFELENGVIFFFFFFFDDTETLFDFTSVDFYLFLYNNKRNKSRNKILPGERSSA